MRDLEIIGNGEGAGGEGEEDLIDPMIPGSTDNTISRKCDGGLWTTGKVGQREEAEFRVLKCLSLVSSRHSVRKGWDE
jgi:hypothetical protein